MKHFLSTTIALALSFLVYSQTDYNKFSMGVNVGTQRGPSHIDNANKPFNLFLAANGRYMLNNVFGFSLDLGYQRWGFNALEDYHTNTIRYSLNAVVNAGNLFRWNDWTKRFGLLLEAGLGGGHLWASERLLEDVEPLTDRMLVLNYGFRPQFKLNERFSLNGHVGFYYNVRQNVTFDWTSQIESPGANVQASYFVGSVGISYNFGKKDRHADWVPLEGADDSKLLALEERLSEMENNMKDDDNDGVPNFRDEELDTPEGAVVDSKGVQIVDTDGDGIPDEYDRCPNEKGEWGHSGCPDSDGDGIPDYLDKCPNEAGLWSLQGCPASANDGVIKEVVIDPVTGQKKSNNVNFVIGQAELQSGSFKSLDGVVDILKNNPDYKVKINGHACSIGDESFNMDLSKRRAESVQKYLEKKGIKRDRMIITAFGETKPVADNNTEDGRIKNRRVELVIVQK